MRARTAPGSIGVRAIEPRSRPCAPTHHPRPHTTRSPIHIHVRRAVFRMNRMDHRPPVSVAPCDLPADLRQWLDSQDLGRLPTLTKDDALKFLNDRGMPVRRNAVVTAFNSKQLVSAIYSGKRLAS